MPGHRIHLFGASGSGTSTLGQALAASLAIPHLDADDYYWKPTDPPYTLKHPPAERIRGLRAVMDDEAGWVLSGSVVSWGDAFLPLFTVAVFVTVPQAVRLRRLQDRERQRYGNRIRQGGDMYETSKAFLEWAALYDTAGPELRSSVLHEAWILDLECPLLRVENIRPVNELVKEIIGKLPTS